MKNFTIQYIVISSILFFTVINAQNFVKIEKLKSNFTKSENKEKYYSNLIINVHETFNNKIEDPNIWIRKLRDAQSIFLKDSIVYNGIKLALLYGVDKNNKLQRTGLEIAYTLYYEDFVDQISTILFNSKDPISFAIAALYLERAGYMEKENDFYINLLKERFADYSENKLLNSLYDDLHNDMNVISFPNIEDLVHHEFQNGKTIIYSFHRKNRKYPGLTIIKKPDGDFVRNEDGSIFHIRQLAQSYSNLPFYIPNGNTPQGIYSIVGWYISPTETIGPTPNVLTRSPFEVSPKIFFHGMNKNSSWVIEDYRSLLPESWKGYGSIYEAYTAGQIGRKLIIIHGSTDDLTYYKSKEYYPLTPTRGCLSSIEIWSENKGTCIQSDQAALINKFRSTNQTKGYLVVIEIDDRESEVKIEEIERYLK